jgi:hypothetical protein
MIAGLIHGVIGIFLFLVGLVISVACFAFWLWMLVHAIQNKALSDGERIVWVLVIIFLPFLGSILYFFIGKPKGYS